MVKDIKHMTLIAKKGKVVVFRKDFTGRIELILNTLRRFFEDKGVTEIIIK